MEFIALAILVVFVISLVIMTRHQREMAMIQQKAAPLDVQHELAALRSGVKELRDTLYHQTVVMEGALRALRIPPEEANSVEKSN